MISSRLQQHTEMQPEQANLCFVVDKSWYGQPYVTKDMVSLILDHKEYAVGGREPKPAKKHRNINPGAGPAKNPKHLCVQTSKGGQNMLALESSSLVQLSGDTRNLVQFHYEQHVWQCHKV